MAGKGDEGRGGIEKGRVVVGEEKIPGFASGTAERVTWLDLDIFINQPLMCWGLD